MGIYSYHEYQPDIDKSCFIADSAQIIGRANLQPEVNIWYGCVLRADVNRITVGENTNIQDLSMLHVTEVDPLIIGRNVTVGHNVTLHACEIKNSALIGMGSVVLDGAIIGVGSVVAAGSVVPPGKVYGDHKLILGNPAKALRDLTPLEIEQYSNHYKSYVGYAREFKDSSIVKRLD